MTLQRESPLPPGRYWADMFRTENFDQVEAMQEWVAANPGLVRVITTESHESEDVPRVWFLFETFEKGGIRPEWVGIGLPTIAPPGVTSSADTVQRPDPEGVTSAPLWAWGLMLGGAGLLLWQLRSIFGGGSK